MSRSNVNMPAARGRIPGLFHEDIRVEFYVFDRSAELDVPDNDIDLCLAHSGDVVRLSPSQAKRLAHSLIKAADLTTGMDLHRCRLSTKPIP